MARTISITVPHDLSVGEAKDRITQAVRSAAGSAGNRARVEAAWTGDTLDVSVSALGQKATGSAMVLPSEVRISGSVPLLLTPFAGQIEGVIAAQAPAFLASRSGRPPGRATRAAAPTKPVARKKVPFWRRWLKRR